MSQLTRDEWDQFLGCNTRDEDWDDRGKLYLEKLRETVAKHNLHEGKNVGQKASRGEVLMEAMRTINGDRQDQYGSPENSFGVVAEFWSIYLRKLMPGVTIHAPDVAFMMMLFKAAREISGAGKHDNAVDGCGYWGLYDDMVKIGVADADAH